MSIKFMSAPLSDDLRKRIIESKLERYPRSQNSSRQSGSQEYRPKEVYLRKVKARPKALLEEEIANAINIVTIKDILGWFRKNKLI